VKSGNAKIASNKKPLVSGSDSVFAVIANTNSPNLSQNSAEFADTSGFPEIPEKVTKV